MLLEVEVVAARFEASLEIDVEVGGFEVSLEVEGEAGRVEALIVYFSCGKDIFGTAGVVLVEMFAMASMRRILKKSASSTSFMISSTSLAVNICSSSTLISCNFSFNIASILVSRFLVFMSSSATSFSKISSDSSINFVTTPLFAARFARSRGRASSVILRWSRFTAPSWAPCYKLVKTTLVLFAFVY